MRDKKCIFETVIDFSSSVNWTQTAGLFFFLYSLQIFRSKHLCVVLNFPVEKNIKC